MEDHCTLSQHVLQTSQLDQKKFATNDHQTSVILEIAMHPSPRSAEHLRFLFSCSNFDIFLMFDLVFCFAQDSQVPESPNEVTCMIKLTRSHNFNLGRNIAMPLPSYIELLCSQIQP